MKSRPEAPQVSCLARKVIVERVSFAVSRVREGTAGKKKGGSPVRGTQESDRIASLAPAQTKVRAGAVLPGSRGPEHQAASAVPQPTDNTYYGSCHLAEVRGKNRWQ